MKKNRTFSGFYLTLNHMRKGSFVRILSISDPLIRSQAMRLGLGQHTVAYCACAIRRGPVVLVIGTQEVALGYSLCKQIQVCPEHSRKRS